MKSQPVETQKEQLERILHTARNTAMGKKYTFTNIVDAKTYRARVSLTDYDSIKYDIEKMRLGAPDVLCKGVVKKYSKSSGTTSDRSKYIPMPNECHYGNHVAASWDTMALVYNENPSAKIFEKKSVIMGGSISTNNGVSTGDISALLLKHMHWAGRPFFTPDFATALLDDWEVKINRMAEQCAKQSIEMIGGVPTWTLVLCDAILKATGKNDMSEIWPTARFYMHGGVGFDPYRKQFDELFPIKGFKYYEVYNASEGYFAVQDESTAEGMLLLLSNNIYYEFIPVEEVNASDPIAVELADVQEGQIYALVITTASGLYRYVIGDLVQIVSTNPYRIKVAGRTKQYINTFGEEVMVANTDAAVAKTCAQLNCSVSEYSVAPIHMARDTKGAHLWVVEFEEGPADIGVFAEALDAQLRKLNSDYDAKRQHDLAMQCLQVRAVPRGTFHKWLRSKGKIGGQNKVPRLSTDMKYINELLKVADYV